MIIIYLKITAVYISDSKKNILRGTTYGKTFKKQKKIIFSCGQLIFSAKSFYASLLHVIMKLLFLVHY